MAKFILDGQEYCGGGSQIVELTQAEYDALPDTKKTDNILYAITDCDELSAENMSCKDANGNLSNVQTEVEKNRIEINKLNSTQLNVNLTPTDSVTKVNEYLRYSITGNLCIVDIGGIVLGSTGGAKIVTTELPPPKNRAVAVLTIDTSPSQTSVEAHTICYTAIGSNNLWVHSTSATVNKTLYGQLIYYV